MNSRKSLVLGLIIFLIIGLYPFHINIILTEFSNKLEEGVSKQQVLIPEISSISNNELINSIFNSKVEDYDKLGFFPTMYESSLQATYYAISTLEAIGKINVINHTHLINYIMSHKVANSSVFIDKLANRYLDTDFSLGYFYPLSSVLEVTCYAILSLNILDRLDLIDRQDSILLHFLTQFLLLLITREMGFIS